LTHDPHRDQGRGDCRYLPLGSIGYENETNERGESLIWLEPTVLARLKAMRSPARATAM
jgi:hypothetical protein